MIRILVPFDGSDPARAALAHARVIVARTQAVVTLVYVLPRNELLAAIGAGSVSAEADATAVLTEASATLSSPAEIRLLHGEPAVAIAAEAERIAADLVVLGSRGRSPLLGLLLGSTARKLLHEATRPLMVVHEPVAAITSIVAGVEPGPDSVRVAQAAAALATATGASVTLVNVVDADRALVAQPEQFGIPAQVWRDALAAHAERAFAPLRAIVPGAVEVLRYGHAGSELRDAVADHGAQVVVVARKGSSGLDTEAWFSVAFTLAVRGPFATLVV
ncbi:MAG: universal stress protein [Pseudomonadota bacterium]|nr:universal stress protein [Pseudomonadota bacterium]